MCRFETTVLDHMSVILRDVRSQDKNKSRAANSDAGQGLMELDICNRSN